MFSLTDRFFYRLQIVLNRDRALRPQIFVRRFAFLIDVHSVQTMRDDVVFQRFDLLAPCLLYTSRCV